MSPSGRPKGEDRSAQREGNLICPSGRPKGEDRSRSAKALQSPCSRELARDSVAYGTL
jgi:hypothetical protein